MRGDLHTLKRVCSYASVAMWIGSIAFILLTSAVIILGIMSFSSPDIRTMFTGLIKCGNGDLALASAIIEMTLAFIAAYIVIKTMYFIMKSIQNEHSPFTQDNAERFKMITVTLLGAAIILPIFEYMNRSDIIVTVCLCLFLVLLTVVSYCITIMFRYGSILQKESDETL